LTFPGEPDDIAARIAAIRETVEEVGVPIGLTPVPDDETLSALRATLHAGTSFGEALNNAGLMLDPALIPFARWLPAHAHMRIFDTRFYLARMPEGVPEPVVDDTENVRVFWATAQSVLDDADAGRVRIIFPTRRNLERLARFASFEEAAADAGRYPIRPVTPWTDDIDGVPHLRIPDDLGYPVTFEPITSALRG
jgi:8-oxo-dGTP pyrophosphatase MutT (NUDIX family)